MFDFISSILFSFSANLDNIPIGLTYGLKKIHISLFKNIFICIITSIVTFLCMFIGQNISKLFNIKIMNIIGAIFLIFLGIYQIIKKIFLKGKNHKLEKKDRRTLIDSNITIKEMITLIITLLLNNIATGFAASITGVELIPTTVSTFIFGTIFLFIGNNLGKRINNDLIINYSEIISSITLILLGIIEFFI